MRKRRETSKHHLPRQESFDGEQPGDVGVDGIRCFIDHEELRRLLAVMAGAELVGAMLAGREPAL